MERPYTGLTAEIKVNNVPIAYASGFDLTLEKAIIEILQFGARYQEKVPAIKDWSASIDGTVALAPGGSQKKLYDAFENDEEITVGIFLDEFTYFEGNAYVSTFNMSGSPDDKISLTADFEGNGATILTLPNTYTIKTSSGVGGTCTPGGTTRVVSGGTHTITIEAAPNYELDTLEDNDVDKTSGVSANVYTLSNVTEDHTITLTFKKISGADKTKLRAAINYADSLTASDYTSSTWSTMQTALTSAKAVNGTANATQVNVNNATATLNTAINSLVSA